MNGVEGDETHLLEVGLAVGCQVFLVGQDVDDLGNEVVSGGALLVAFGNAAFQGEGEVGEYGCVDFLGFGVVPAGLGNLVGRVFAAGDAYVVGGYQGLLGGEGHGEFIVSVKVLGGGMRAHGDHDFFSIPLSAPCCIHGVGGAIVVVGADDQHGLGEEPGLGFERFHSVIVLFVIVFFVGWVRRCYRVVSSPVSLSMM